MSDEPMTETQPASDPVLAALSAHLEALAWALDSMRVTMEAQLSDLRAQVDGLREDNAVWRAQLDALQATLIEPEGEAGPEPEPLPQWTELDTYLSQVVREIYADQGHAPVSTLAVATRTGFVPGYAVRLLGDAAAHGAIYAVPGRGKRRSGKWLPFAPSS